MCVFLGGGGLGGVNHTRCWGTCAIYILSDNTYTHTAREEMLMLMQIAHVMHILYGVTKRWAEEERWKSYF